MTEWVETKIDDALAKVKRDAIVAVVQMEDSLTKLLLAGGHSVLAEGKLSDFVAEGTGSRMQGGF